MTSRRLRHVVGLDDAPFAHDYRGDVLLVGAVFSGMRPDGILSGKVRRDGANATRVVAEMVRRSRFHPQMHAVLLQGIAFAGCNVVDLPQLHALLGVPVIVVSRRRPDFATIRRALLDHVPGGARKWRRIEAAGPDEALDTVYVQRAGVTFGEARELIRALSGNSAVPEPLRVAHMVAGGVTLGESRGRA